LSAESACSGNALPLTAVTTDCPQEDALLNPVALTTSSLSLGVLEIHAPTTSELKSAVSSVNDEDDTEVQINMSKGATKSSQPSSLIPKDQTTDTTSASITISHSNSKVDKSLVQKKSPRKAAKTLTKKEC
jgi:F0F1-type ATP synthase epsilon subunit